MIITLALRAFVEKAPTAVMTRLALDWIVDAPQINQIFQDIAEQ